MRTTKGKPMSGNTSFIGANTNPTDAVKQGIIGHANYEEKLRKIQNDTIERVRGSASKRR